MLFCSAHLLQYDAGGSHHHKGQRLEGGGPALPGTEGKIGNYDSRTLGGSASYPIHNIKSKLVAVGTVVDEDMSAFESLVWLGVGVEILWGWLSGCVAGIVV